MRQLKELKLANQDFIEEFKKNIAKNDKLCYLAEEHEKYWKTIDEGAELTDDSKRDGYQEGLRLPLLDELLINEQDSPLKNYMKWKKSLLKFKKIDKKLIDKQIQVNQVELMKKRKQSVHELNEDIER